MNASTLRTLLQQLQSGNLSIDQTLDRLRNLPFESLGYANVDHHRMLRQGVPEAILCEGKTEAQVLGIARGILKQGVAVLATRADSKIARALKRLHKKAVHHQEARMVVIQQKPPKAQGDILVLTAGTADIPVAEETKVTASVLGSRVELLCDIGVAGVHRLLHNLERIQQARVVVVVAGMDGVLPTVVSGLIDKPVVAVPTSQGYGSHFGGIAPLLTMLNACSGGIGVVNIDNGFGAGYLAHRINLLPGR